MTRRILRAALVGVALAVAAASCSLGLDESLIGADAAPSATPTGTNPGTDGATDGNPLPPSDGATDGGDTCRNDGDCKGSGCLVGKCDTTAGRCTYEICPQTDPCKAARCDAATNACQSPVTLPLHEDVTLPEQVNVAGQFRAMAIVPPFLFLPTASGVVAYLYDEPGTPKTVKAVAGAPFVPTYLFGSGRRLYMVGTPVGTSQRRIPIAWLDVPANPTAELRAESSFVAFAGQSLSFVFPFLADEAVFAHQNPNPSFAVAEPPFATAISPSPTATAQNYLGFIGSGDRIVAIRSFFSSAAPAVSLVTNVRTTPTFGAEVVLSPGPQFTFQSGAQLASNGKGTTVMSWPLYNTVVPYSGAVSQVRLAWILDDDKDTSLAATDFVDPTSFPPPGVPMYSNLAGPMAFADDRTVFATFAAAGAPTTRLAAGFFVRGGGDAGASDAGTNTLTEFAMAPPQIHGVAAAPGIGAVLGASGTVLHYVRQGCPGP